MAETGAGVNVMAFGCSNPDFRSVSRKRDSMSHPTEEPLGIADAPGPQHGKLGVATLELAEDEVVSRARALLTRNRELEALIEEKSQLLAMAVHDLRNPVGNILILTELLLEEADEGLSDEQKEFLQVIHSASEYTQRLLDSIFALSVVASNSFRLSFELRDPGEILERVVLSNRSCATARDIQIALRVDRPVPRIKVDPDRMDQVFNALINNAIRYSQAGGYVEVRISTESDAVHISVRDNGSGIPSQDLQTLFAAFQRTLARGIQRGRGMGLAIAKCIVGRHGGQIWAESEVGCGSTFHVRLPILDRICLVREPAP